MSNPIRIHSLEDLSRRVSRTRKGLTQSTAQHPLTLSLLGTSSSIPFRVTSQELSLTLPIPPSINQQYATVNGRRILSSKSRQYKTMVAQQILSILTSSPNRTVLQDNLKTHSLTLSVWFYFTTALRRDLDGGLKISQDAICNALGINDNRIIEIHLYKSVDAASPRMECTLSLHQPNSPPRLKKNTFNSKNNEVSSPHSHRPHNL